MSANFVSLSSAGSTGSGSQAPSRAKVLLLGKHSSGKTSMRSVIFANFLAQDTQRLGPTMGVEHAHFRFLNNLVLNLWDCGGQDRFYKSYFESQREHIFKNVETLVYVFDSKSMDAKDLQYYRESLDSLMALSPRANVFVLVHKIDPKDGTPAQREAIFRDCEERILARSAGLETRCFPTSIFDDTLLNAWSAIVEALVPNVGVVQRLCNDLMGACEAEEVVLFERATCLVVASATHKDSRPRDARRFQRISACIKRYRLSCSMAQFALSAIKVTSPGFSVLMDQLSDTTVVLIAVTDPAARFDLVPLRVDTMRADFERCLGF